MLEDGETIVTKDDLYGLPDYYEYQMSLSSHRIIKTKSGVIRYEKMNFEQDIDINAMWVKYHRGELTRDYMMQFYRDIGYSIDGYEDVWGGEMEKMRMNAAYSAPIEEIEQHWKDVDFAVACDNAAWDLTQEIITSPEEAVELLRLAASRARKESSR